MRRQVLAFVSGGLFSAGLVLGGMTEPRKVRGFLDVLGAWDARLSDARLLGGAAPFGAGWGLSGLCPGPALASGDVRVLAFVLLMLLGMRLAEALQPRTAPAGKP